MPEKHYTSSDLETLKRSFRAQWFMLVIGLTIIAGVIAYQSFSGHRNITDWEDHRLQTQTRVIALNIEQQLEATNLALESIVKDIVFLRKHENLQLTNRRLQVLTDAMPGIRTILVLNANGVVVASNRENLLGMDLRARTYFTTSASDNNPSTLYLSPPFKSALGVFVINISRVIPASNGQFNGLVAASLDPDYFKVLLDSVLYAPDMIDTIDHGDGIRFMAIPDKEGQAGRNLALPGTFNTLHKKSGRLESLMSGISPSYKTRRIVAIRTIKSDKLKLDKPLYVSCSRDCNVVYNTWRKTTLIQAFGFILVSAIAGFSLALLQRHQRRLAISAARSRELVNLRYDLMEYATTHSLPELLRQTLDEICRISDSPIGFYHYVEADQRTISLQAWSTRTEKEFCTAAGQGQHYPIEEAGVWADSLRQRIPVIHNDYMSLPQRKGLPEGHAPVIRELVVPILRADKVVAIIGIGNKSTDYTKDDVEIVSHLADTAWEIIERKHAEKMLQKNEERFRTVADYTYDWEYWISPAGDMLYTSPSCVRVTGYTVEEYVNNPDLLQSIVHPDDRSKLVSHLECIAMESEAHHDDFRIITKDGETRWISHSCQAVYDDKGCYTGRRASNREISERKEIELALNKSRQLLADIFNFLPDATFVVDSDMKVIAWNRTMEEMSGVLKEEILGLGDHAYTIPFYGERRSQMLDLIDVDDAELKAKYQGITRKGEHLFGEAFCPALYDGKGAHIWSIVAPLYDGDGKRIGAIQSLRDITSIKETEANLVSSNRELEQFAYVASHDLQEPLRKIAGFTELLANRYKGSFDEKGESYMAYIVDGATRMKSLINDLLSYSRVMRREKTFVETDTTAVVSGTLQDLEIAIKESNAEIICGELPVIQADPTQLGQLFQNLIGNAIKYRGKDVPKITINAIKNRTDWLFSVVDNGIGIAPEFSERIFAIFQRLHTKSEYPGTGIGLAVCQKIVERHGGKIWVESTLGAGSTFFFTVPAKQRKVK